MEIFRSKHDKQINLSFSISRNHILDFKVHFNEYGLYEITLDFLWVGVQYMDWYKTPF